MKRTLIAMMVVGAIAALAGPGHADPARAKQLNREGMSAYKKQDYQRARTLFEKAIAEDPSLAVAHYNLASMAALMRDVDVVLAQLDWLAAAADRDPVAAAKLAKARTDRDFVAVSTHPKVRAAVGLARFDSLTVEQKLREAGGVWSGIDQGCSGGWFEYTVAARGKLTSRTYCDDDGKVRKRKGRWKTDKRGVHFTVGRTTYDFRFQRCGSRDDSMMEADGSMCLSGELAELSRGPAE